MNKIGSSETIRETTFNFINVQQKIVSHKTFIKTSFLEWFVGFSEGDGSFIVSNKKNQLFFIINQKEEKVLYYIRANLGFGKVSKYCSYSRYIVADRGSVDRLISIFNGNLVLNKTNARFVLWLVARNQYSTEEICYRGINKFVTFHKNGWLSGFTDAEGCFNAQKLKDTRYTLGFRIRLRFILDQKGEYPLFEKCKFFLKSGSITNRKKVVFPCTRLSKPFKIPMRRREHKVLLKSTILTKRGPTRGASFNRPTKKNLLLKYERVCALNMPLQKHVPSSYMYRFTSTHMKSHDILCEYFKEYPLRTIKKVPFTRFTSLCYYIKNRQSLPWTGKVLLRIENLVKNLNSDKS